MASTVSFDMIPSSQVSENTDIVFPSFWKQFRFEASDIYNKSLSLTENLNQQFTGTLPGENIGDSEQSFLGAQLPLSYGHKGKGRSSSDSIEKTARRRVQLRSAQRAYRRRQSIAVQNLKTEISRLEVLNHCITDELEQLGISLMREVIPHISPHVSTVLNRILVNVSRRILEAACNAQTKGPEKSKDCENETSGQSAPVPPMHESYDALLPAELMAFSSDISYPSFGENSVDFFPFLSSTIPK